MAQFTRTKKLTDYAYSPTDPSSEDAIRLQVDNSIQEIQDILYSQDAGKGASQVGINGLAYATVQDLAQVVSDSGTGTAPPALSVGLAQQATTVKTGLLADLTTTDKDSLVDAINEVDAKFESATSPLDLTAGVLTIQASSPNQNGYMSIAQATKLEVGYDTLSSNFTTVSATYVETGLELPVVSGRDYKMSVISLASRSGGSTAFCSLFLKSGSGTIVGISTTGNAGTSNSIQITAIGANGLAGSISNTMPQTVTGAITYDCIFKCTSTGVIALGTIGSGTTTIFAGSSITAQWIN